MVPITQKAMKAYCTRVGFSRACFYLTTLHARVACLRRAIGVIYSPPNEACVPTILTHRYDSFIYFDEAQALAPL